MGKCLEPFKNILLHQEQQLGVAPCSLVHHQPVGNTVDFFNNPNLVKIRNEFRQGLKPVECSACWDKEAHGIQSRRMMNQEWYQQNCHDDSLELISIDYWIGNICNLKCVTCGPDASSAWQQELDPTRKSSPHYDNKFWKHIDLTKIRKIHFTGGEPLLSKSHVELLQAIPDKSKVNINYNTNGTIFPSDELFSLWAEFKQVDLYVSIDDIEDRFEYLRYPANWNNTVATILAIQQRALYINFKLSINTSISVLNIFTYPTLVQWVGNTFGIDTKCEWQWVNHDYLDARTMHIRFKSILEDIYADRDDFVRSINFVEDDQILQNQIQFLKQLDARRGNDYQKIFDYLL